MSERMRRAASYALLAAVFFGAARLGLAMALVYPNVSSVWPAAAIGPVGLLLLGRGAWIGVFAGAFAVNLQFTLERGILGFGSCAAVSAAIAASNALEALAGAWVAERFAGGRNSIESGTGVLKLVLGTGLLCTTISASLSVPALHLAGTLPASETIAAWLTWWLGGAAGVLVWAPLLLAWTSPAPQRFAGGVWEAAALSLYLAANVWFVFWKNDSLVAYLVMPGVIWTALRFGTRGSGLAVIFLSCAAMAATAVGRGEFATGSVALDMLALQGFLATIAVSSYAMAAIVWERERAEGVLRRSRDELEAEVERRTSELVKSQKMEAIGRLSGVVAHEFKNALHGISGFAELIRRQAPAGSRIAEDADEITAACQRSGAVAGRLLSLSRGSASGDRPMDLNALVSASAKLLRLSAGGSVELKLELGPGTPAVVASAEQLEQILLNLCLNAKDAMTGSGRVTVSTREETLSEPRALTHGRLPAGRYAVLSVGDEGSGVAAEAAGKLFEPFFSTKKTGEGTGLGLSIVRGIVEAHHGAIDLASRPGATVFSLYFPATSRAPEVPPAGLPHPRGSETLLIAEDDPAGRGLLIRVLEPLGYRLLVASDGEEAWDLYKGHAPALAMAVLDVNMPKLSGDEVYDRIAAIRPGFKTLLICADPGGREGRAARDRRLDLLPKPFTAERLAAAVRELLDR